MTSTRALMLKSENLENLEALAEELVLARVVESDSSFCRG